VLISVSFVKELRKLYHETTKKTIQFNESLEKERDCSRMQHWRCGKHTREQPQGKARLSGKGNFLHNKLELASLHCAQIIKDIPRK
jgi:hypothetical protein